jgi:hypothetical protein
MPELAEVNRAAGILRRIALGKRITSTRTKRDDIVFVDEGQARFVGLQAAYLRGLTPGCRTMRWSAGASRRSSVWESNSLYAPL